MPTLLVDSVDDEQVWQQLVMRNKPLLRYVESQLRKQLRANNGETETSSRARVNGQQDTHEYEEGEEEAEAEKEAVEEEGEEEGEEE